MKISVMIRRIWWTTFLLLFIFAEISQAKWTMDSRAEKCDDSRTVHIITAKNETNIVHFVFAADKHVRPPAVLVLHSTYDKSAVHVDCSKYANDTTFRGSMEVDAVTASYGVIVYELCDYEDVDDKCSIVSVDDCLHYFGSNLDWELESFQTTSPSHISIAVRGTQMNDSHDLFLPGGGILIQLSVFDTDTQPTGDYYYKVSGGLGMAITVTVDQLKVLHPRTRVAPVLLVFSNQSLEDNDDFLQVDGYAEGLVDGPGGQLMSSYLMLNQRVLSTPTETDFPPGFMHFTPASWIAPIKDKGSMRSATVGPRSVFRHHGRAKKFTHSLPYAYYKDRFNPIHQGPHTGFVGIREQWINLGSPGDGFYRASNYSSWTMVLSLGTPAVKPVVSGGSARGALIAIGVLALLGGGGGGGVWFYRRRKHRQPGGPTPPIFRFERSGYEPMSDLSQSVPEHALTTTTTDVNDYRSISEGSSLLSSVEPFQRRKAALFPFRIGSNRSGTSSHQPLLTSERPPPDYHAVVSTPLA